MINKRLSSDINQYLKKNQINDVKQEFNILIKKAQNGCVESTNKIIMAHVLYVISLISKINKTNIDELVNVSVLALYKCIRDFDITRSSYLSTFIHFYVKKVSIIQLAKNYNIHLPYSVKINFYKSTKDNFEKIAIRGYGITLEEIESSYKMSKDISKILFEQINKNNYDKVNENYIFSLISDILNIKENKEEISHDIKCFFDIDQLQFLINFLKPKDKDIIIKFFGLFGHERKDVAQLSVEYNITKQAISYHVQSIIKKLRKYANENNETFI